MFTTAAPPDEESHDVVAFPTSLEALVLVVAGTPVDGWPVGALNPEAGSHHVTRDRRELAAALRAGEHTWERFVYYELRYGERGRRFTRSDSAWIVAVATEPCGGAGRQLRWLADLLAARGMPRWLLELHLGVLHAALVEAVPEHGGHYDQLLKVASMFRRERLRHLDDETSAVLAAAFDRRVGRTTLPRVPEAGALLVAAVADERAGVKGSVESLLAWLADPERFPPHWVAATTVTIEAARVRAR